MGIGKRLIDVARANVTDFASAFSRDPDTRERRRLDEELEEEVAREVRDTVGAKAGRKARRVADKAEEAWERAFEEARARGGTGRSGGHPSEREIENWHRTLEVPVGADFDTIRKSYRRLMAKYHPDKYASDPEKYAAATEVTRKIAGAYNGLKALQHA
ncbi:MAG TPA: J domain-containing protein [Enhygromyxa sp.]|nr:J domain-containing protein [Enhygromyxa sp.]